MLSICSLAVMVDFEVHEKLCERCDGFLGPARLGNLLNEGHFGNFHLAPGEVNILYDVLRSFECRYWPEGHHVVDLRKAKGILILGMLVHRVCAAFLGKVPKLGVVEVGKSAKGIGRWT